MLAQQLGRVRQVDDQLSSGIGIAGRPPGPGVMIKPSILLDIL
jgi:hypothetical protein